jgi:hypothetical protein
LIKVAEEVLADSVLTVERTRAGYARDYGDILIKTADDQILGTIQAKNRRKWEIPAWLDATLRQAIEVRARFSALIVKRIGAADPGRSFAIMPADQWLRLLATLAERERELATQHAELIRFRAAPIREAYRRGEVAAPPVVTRRDLGEPDPDVIPDEPGTVRGAVVYPRGG